MKSDKLMEKLLADGFTRRMAHVWSSEVRREIESGLYSSGDLEWAHEHGLLAASALTYERELVEEGLYFSDYDYYRLWPLNPWQRIWINDKLTLRYLLDGTCFEGCLPRYYFYSDASGHLVPLLDSREGASLSSILERDGDIACKPCNGAGSIGFFRLRFAGDRFYLNDSIISRNELDTLAASHRNYVFTEFISPVDYMAKVDPLIHTLRLLVVNPHHDDPFIAGGYLRFGLREIAERTGSANYAAPVERGDRVLVCGVNLETGEYGDGRLVYADCVSGCLTHPDSGEKVEGRIECWRDVEDLVLGISRHLAFLPFLGFDVGITQDGPKLMEINSHSGIHYIQLFRPLLSDDRFAEFIHGAALRIELLGEDGRVARAGILR